MKAIKNVRIIRGGRILDETVLLYENRILDVASEVPAVADVLDGHGLYLCAGLIDQHIHGYRGEDTMTHSPRAWPPHCRKTALRRFCPPP